MGNIHVFDMDNTLIQSKEVTLAAYKRAAEELGLQVPTEKLIWGRTCAEWSCPLELHELKTKYYAEMANTIVGSWAVAAYTAACAEKDVFVRVWTGASVQTLAILQRVPHLRSLLRNARAGMMLHDKRAAMLGLRHVCADTPIHYYDDDNRDADIVTSGISNIIIHSPGHVVAIGASTCG